MIQFGAPWWLLTLLVLPLGLLLRAWSARRRRAQLGRLADADFAGPLGLGPRVERARGRESAWLLAGLLCLAAALARPQLGFTLETQRSEGRDLVVALDLSRSMLAEDLAPSRLERAKIEIRELVRGLAGDRVGLVGFTTVAQPLSPLTTDGRHVLLQLERIQPEGLPSGGTSIGAGIDSALQLLTRAETGTERAERAIVVFTDGEDHANDGRTQARAAAEAGIRVHVVGLGGDSGEPIPLLRDGRRAGYVKDAMGRTVLTRLEPEGIRAVAAAGDGVAVVQAPGRGLDMAPLREAVAAMRSGARESERTRRNYIERYRWLLLPALLCFGASAWSRLALAWSLALLLVAGWGHSREASAQPMAPDRPGTRAEDPDADGLEAPEADRPPPLLRRPVPELEAARRDLAGGDADAALRRYEAAVERLGPRPEALLGRGLARLSAEAARASAPGAAGSGAAPGQAQAAGARPPEPPPEALQDLQSAADAASAPGLRAQALTALGNAHRKSGDLDQALQAYKDALRADPDAEDARRNLALTQALRRIKEPSPPASGDGEQKQDPSEQQQNEGEPSPKDEEEGEGQERPKEEPPKEGEAESSSGSGEDEPPEPPEGGQDGTPAEEQEEPRPPEGDPGRASEGEEGQPAEEDATTRILRSLEQKEQELQRKRLLKRLQAPRVNKPW